MKALILILIVVAALAFAGGAVLTPLPVTSSQSHPQVVAHPQVAAASRDSASSGDPDAYGSDVTHAVAEYSLDPAGALYELHAPQVELPRLGGPQS